MKKGLIGGAVIVGAAALAAGAGWWHPSAPSEWGLLGALVVGSLAGWRDPERARARRQRREATALDEESR